MKSFKYRDFEISAQQMNGPLWCVTIDGLDPFISKYDAWYNVEWEGKRRWWHSGDHSKRTFEDALINALERADLRLMRRAKAEQHEKLMEARLSLAEELLP